MKKSFLCITLLFAFYNVNNASCEIILGTEMFLKNEFFCKVNRYLKQLAAGSKSDSLLSNRRIFEKPSSGKWCESSVGSTLFSSSANIVNMDDSTDNQINSNVLDQEEYFPLEIEKFSTYSSSKDRLKSTSKLVKWGDTVYVNRHHKILSFQFNNLEKKCRCYYSFGDESAKWQVMDNLYLFLLTDISLGTSHLRLKVVSDTGIFQQEICIIRIPTWWESDSFKIFCVIIILSLLSVIFILFRKRRKRKNRVEEEPVSLPLETKQEESSMEMEDVQFLFKRIEKLVEDLPADETGDSFDEKVRKCLSENIANEELTVEKLGQMLGYSRVQLFRKIKEKYNLSPSEYIRKYRLAYALKLLLQEDLRVSEVSFMCGFPDPNRFSKHFSKEFGFPPSAAREHMSDMVNKREPLAGHMDHKVFFDDIIVR